MSKLGKELGYKALFTWTEEDLFRAQYEINKALEDAHKIKKNNSVDDRRMRTYVGTHKCESFDSDRWDSLVEEDFFCGMPEEVVSYYKHGCVKVWEEDDYVESSCTQDFRNEWYEYEEEYVDNWE